MAEQNLHVIFNGPVPNETVAALADFIVQAAKILGAAEGVLVVAGEEEAPAEHPDAGEWKEEVVPEPEYIPDDDAGNVPSFSECLARVGEAHSITIHRGMTDSGWNVYIDNEFQAVNKSLPAALQEAVCSWEERQ